MMGKDGRETATISSKIPPHKYLLFTTQRVQYSEIIKFVDIFHNLQVHTLTHMESKIHVIMGNTTSGHKFI